MVELLVLLVICLCERIGKSIQWSCKIGWVFIKFTGWLIVVPGLNIGLLGFTLVAYILCKLFRHQTPRLAHTKRWIIYPAW